METQKVESIKKGEFVRRKADSKKTYIRGEFCRELNRYVLTDFDDINRVVLVKKGCFLFVGFEF